MNFHPKQEEITRPQADFARRTQMAFSKPTLNFVDNIKKPVDNRVNIFTSKDEEEPPAGLGNCEFSTPACSSIDDYSLHHVIGKGAYAEVTESIHKKTGEKVAIKKYDRYKLLDL